VHGNPNTHHVQNLRCAINSHNLEQTQSNECSFIIRLSSIRIAGGTIGKEKETMSSFLLFTFTFCLETICFYVSNFI